MLKTPIIDGILAEFHLVTLYDYLPEMMRQKHMMRANNFIFSSLIILDTPIQKSERILTPPEVVKNTRSHYDQQRKMTNLT